MSEFLIKVPQSIEVGGLTYRIEYDSKLLHYEGNLGQCDHRKQLITMGYSHTPDGQDETLWHELTHAVNRSYLNGKLSEDDINSISTGQYQVLKQLGIRFDWSERS